MKRPVYIKKQYASGNISDLWRRSAGRWYHRLVCEQGGWREVHENPYGKVFAILDHTREKGYYAEVVGDGKTISIYTLTTEEEAAMILFGVMEAV